MNTPPVCPVHDVACITVAEAKSPLRLVECDPRCAAQVTGKASA